jgi:hypothetical protein
VIFDKTGGERVFWVQMVFEPLIKKGIHGLKQNSAIKLSVWWYCKNCTSTTSISMSIFLGSLGSIVLKKIFMGGEKEIKVWW